MVTNVVQRIVNRRENTGHFLANLLGLARLLSPSQPKGKMATFSTSPFPCIDHGNFQPFAILPSTIAKRQLIATANCQEKQPCILTPFRGTLFNKERNSFAKSSSAATSHEPASIRPSAA